MKKTFEFLQDALEKLGDLSDRKKAEQLKISPQALSDYKSGNRVMDDYACIVVAEYLGIDPLEIIAAANMEREKNQAKKDFWQDFRKKITQLVVGGLVITTMAFSPVTTEKAPQGV